MTRDELRALVAARRAEFYAGDPLYCAYSALPAEHDTPPACDVCSDGGTVQVALGPVDRLSGQPDEIVETPCPACAAGDREAEARIGRPWRNTNVQDPTKEGAAALTTVEARGTAHPNAGCREHNPQGDVGRASGAQLTGPCQDGPSQGPACEQYPVVAHDDDGANPSSPSGGRPWRDGREAASDG